MPCRECDCKEFQDSGHTDECNEHYKPQAMTPTPNNDESRRRDFEQDAEPYGYDLTPATEVQRKFSNYSYHDEATQHRWWGFESAYEAATAAREEEVRELVEALWPALGALCACRHVTPIDGPLVDEAIAQVRAALAKHRGAL